MALRLVFSRTFRPLGGAYAPRRLRRRPIRVLRGGEGGVAVRFRVSGSDVGIEVWTAGESTADDVTWAVDRARGIAGVDDDPGPFLASVRSHPVLSELSRGADPRMFRTPTVFEAYASAVIEQLVTGMEARAAIARLGQTAGALLPGTRHRAAPTATEVRAVPMWRLREIGIGARRAAALREGALRGPALERLVDIAPADAIAKLQCLRGVGPWTANAVARDALAYADAVPIGDLHVPGLVTEALTGERGGDDEMLALLEPFRPHRARVVLLIERAAFGVGLAPRRWRPPRIDSHRRTPWLY